MPAKTKAELEAEMEAMKQKMEAELLVLQRPSAAAGAVPRPHAGAVVIVD